jgi:hypothetical protein
MTDDLCPARSGEAYELYENWTGPRRASDPNSGIAASPPSARSRTSATTARRKSTASLPSRTACRASAGVPGYCDPTGNLYDRGNAHSVDVVKSHYASTAEPMFLA